MKCIYCGFDNKKGVKFCKRCGRNLYEKKLWIPDWRWHLKALAIIYAVLIALYFLISWIFQPYLREIPKDLTPWLK